MGNYVKLQAMQFYVRMHLDAWGNFSIYVLQNCTVKLLDH